MRLIFLDCDGVINKHVKHHNGYCGTDPECVQNLNAILDAVPSAKVVVSSAWRYMILSGEMTLQGFESLLLSHGVSCKGRIIGHTVSDESDPNYDPSDFSWTTRRWQIEEYLRGAGRVAGICILDDGDLNWVEDEFVQTVSENGLTAEDAERAIEILTFPFVFPA